MNKEYKFCLTHNGEIAGLEEFKATVYAFTAGRNYRYFRKSYLIVDNGDVACFKCSECQTAYG